MSASEPLHYIITCDTFTLHAIRFGAFFHKLGELVYLDGETISIDYLSAEGQGERFPGMAQECLRRGADIIAVSTTPAAQAAKAATATVPIVMTGLAVDPVETGLVASFARPGGNITGQSFFDSSIAA